jgi:phosphohistidine swiveling domain-containing protein
MAELVWDKTGERLYETGVDHGVLYIPDSGGDYTDGVAWNGLTAVTESPTGAESNPQYADNIKYLNLISAEEFGATIEAFTYPDEFGQFDGSASPTPGIVIGQQNRRPFGLSYRTLLGNDLENTDYGYKLHLVYGATAAPSEKAYATVNDSPEATAFSWELTTQPVAVPGTNPVTGKPYKPTASLTINSTEVDPAKLQELEDLLYGTVGSDPSLPLPGAVIALFAGTPTLVNPAAPTYDAGTDIITIPGTAGVIYKVMGETAAAGPYGPITEDTIVNAYPASGYVFPDVVQDEWFFDFV